MQCFNSVGLLLRGKKYSVNVLCFTEKINAAQEFPGSIGAVVCCTFLHTIIAVSGLPIARLFGMGCLLHATHGAKESALAALHTLGLYAYFGGCFALGAMFYKRL